MILNDIIPTQTVIGVTAIFSMTVSPAFAHMGHLGDLAGHSHWAGIALAGAAVALGGLLAKDKRKKNSGTEDSNAGENQEDIGDEVHA